MGADPIEVNKIKGLAGFGPSGTTRNAGYAEPRVGFAFSAFSVVSELNGGPEPSAPNFCDPTTAAFLL